MMSTRIFGAQWFYSLFRLVWSFAFMCNPSKGIEEGCYRRFEKITLSAGVLAELAVSVCVVYNLDGKKVMSVS